MWKRWRRWMKRRWSDRLGKEPVQEECEIEPEMWWGLRFFFFFVSLWMCVAQTKRKTMGRFALIKSVGHVLVRTTSILICRPRCRCKEMKQNEANWFKKKKRKRKRERQFGLSREKKIRLSTECANEIVNDRVAANAITRRTIRKKKKRRNWFRFRMDAKCRLLTSFKFVWVTKLCRWTWTSRCVCLCVCVCLWVGRFSCVAEW